MMLRDKFSNVKTSFFWDRTPSILVFVPKKTNFRLCSIFLELFYYRTSLFFFDLQIYRLTPVRSSLLLQSFGKPLINPLCFRNFLKTSNCSILFLNILGIPLIVPLCSCKYLEQVFLFPFRS